MSQGMYKVGDVVWAKPSGCPWRPAVISSIKYDKHHKPTAAHLDIIGKNSSHLLPLSRIAPFNEKYDEYSRKKETRLMSAISAARRIMDKQSTYAGKLYYK